MSGQPFPKAFMCKIEKCGSLTKKGTRCRLCIGKHSKFCHVHSKNNSIPMSSKDVAIRQLEKAIVIQGRISDRGDVVGIREAFLDLDTNLEGRKRFTHFIYYWALRDPDMIQDYVREDHNLNAAKRKKYRTTYMKRLRIYLKPEVIEVRWSSVAQQTAIEKLADRLYLFEQDKAAPTMLDGKEIISLASELYGVKEYASTHLFRTACLVLGKDVPGDNFFVMGQGADAAKFRVLTSHGLTCLTDINAELDNPIDAGELSFYMCMGELYQKGKLPNGENTIPEPEHTSYTTKPRPVKAKK